MLMNGHTCENPNKPENESVCNGAGDTAMDVIISGACILPYRAYLERESISTLAQNHDLELFSKVKLM